MKSIKKPFYRNIHVQLNNQVVELKSSRGELKEVRLIDKPRKPRAGVATFQYGDDGFVDALDCYKKGIISLDPWRFWSMANNFFVTNNIVAYCDIEF